MRPCPRCAERIQDEAVVCRFCGAELPDVTPVRRTRKTWWIHGLLAFVALAFAPPLDALLQRSAILVGIAVVCALSLLIAILAGRRSGAPRALREIGRHPAWGTYVAVLLLLAAMPKASPRGGGAAVGSPVSAATNSPAAIAAGASSARSIADALAQEQDAKRRAIVAKAIADARAFAAEKKTCGTLDEVTGTWASLRDVKPSDSEYREAKGAASRLEKCRLLWRDILRRGSEELMVAQREAWAKQLDTIFLDNGFDVRISLAGAAKDRITITWPLMTRVTVHQLNKSGDLIEGATKAGIRRITIGDGFAESWYYDLSSEKDAAAERALAQQGLAEPMKL